MAVVGQPQKSKLYFIFGIIVSVFVYSLSLNSHQQCVRAVNESKVIMFSLVTVSGA